MNINYISLGSFCHPKMFLRKKNKEILKSLPFDFHSTPNTYSIYNILNKLHQDKTYIHNFNEILFEHEYNDKEKKELAISDSEGIYFLHFFDLNDKINNNNEYPIQVKDNINENKIEEIQNKFKQRYENLYEILNNKKDILIFLRIENYENKVWDSDLKNLVESLNKFDNPNKFLIYTQIEIDDDLDFNKSKKINYDYNFPIIFYKFLFDEKISSDEVYEQKFNNIIVNIENIISLCILINFNNVNHYYYYDKNNNKLFKLNDIHFVFNIEFFDNKMLKVKKNNQLFVFLKNNDNIFELIS